MAPDDSYGELITGGTTLSFASTKLAGSNLATGFVESNLTNKPFGIEIGFTTNDVDATVKSSIEAGAPLLQRLKQNPGDKSLPMCETLTGS